MPHVADDKTTVRRPIRQPNSRSGCGSSYPVDHSKSYISSTMSAASGPSSPAGSSLSSDDGRMYSPRGHNEGERPNSPANGGNGNGGQSLSPTVSYPSRSGVPDCQYYLKTGKCNYGSRCKFNHPHRDERLVNALNRRDCFDFVQTGTCPYGRSCKYNHPARSDLVGSPVSSAQGTPATTRFLNAVHGVPDSLGLPSAAVPARGQVCDGRGQQQQNLSRQQLFPQQSSAVSTPGGRSPSGMGAQSWSDLVYTATEFPDRKSHCSGACGQSSMVCGSLPQSSIGCGHSVIGVPSMSQSTGHCGETQGRMSWPCREVDVPASWNCGGIDAASFPSPREAANPIPVWNHGGAVSAPTAHAVPAVSSPSGTTGYFVFVSGVNDADEARQIAQQAAAASQQVEKGPGDTAQCSRDRSSIASSSRLSWGCTHSIIPGEVSKGKQCNEFMPFSSPYGPSLFSAGSQTWGPTATQGSSSATTSLFDLLADSDRG